MWHVHGIGVGWGLVMAMVVLATFALLVGLWRARLAATITASIPRRLPRIRRDLSRRLDPPTAPGAGRSASRIMRNADRSSPGASGPLPEPPDPAVGRDSAAVAGQQSSPTRADEITTRSTLAFSAHAGDAPRRGRLKRSLGFLMGAALGVGALLTVLSSSGGIDDVREALELCAQVQHVALGRARPSSQVCSGATPRTL